MQDAAFASHHTDDHDHEHDVDHGAHHKELKDIHMRNLRRVQRKVGVLEKTGLAQLMVHSINTIIQLRPRNAVVGLCRLLAEQCTPTELDEVGIILEDPPTGPNSALRPEHDWHEQGTHSEDEAEIEKPEEEDGREEEEQRTPTPVPEEQKALRDQEPREELQRIAKISLLQLFDGMFSGAFFHDANERLCARHEKEEEDGGA